MKPILFSLALLCLTACGVTYETAAPVDSVSSASLGTPDAEAEIDRNIQGSRE